MRKHIFILLAFIVLAFKSNAQSNITYQGFEIAREYRENNDLRVANSNIATPFKFMFALGRGLISGGGYQPGTCKVSLIYTEQYNQSSINGDPSTLVLYSKNVTSSDYNNNTSLLAVFYDVNTSLPANKTNGYITLRYEYLNTENKSQTNFSPTRYNIYIVPPPIVTTITNNVISVYDNGVNYPVINGSTPIISTNVRYDVRYEIKNANGVFESSQWPVFFGYDINGTFLNGIIANVSGTYRRVITVVSGVSPIFSYSNEIFVTATQTTLPNSFTTTKTEVFDNNGLLIGNNIKIVLDHPDPNIRFKALLFGPDDPYYLPINNNSEFFLPMYYNNDRASYFPETNSSVDIISNAGSSINVKPTWK